jgi:hypothetical protein
VRPRRGEADASGSEEGTVPAPIGGMLRIHNSNGRTRITGEDRSDIEVKSLKTARAESEEAAAELIEEIQLVLNESPEGLDLEVEVPRRWNRRGSANLCIRLPREMVLAVVAANGRVDISGVRGPVKARSSNGSVSVSDVVGDIEVATSNAKVCCSGSCGRLMARSSNGKIEIEQHRGSVDASTSNGLIRAALDEIGKQGVHLATSNGRIVLDLPEDADADVDIRVDNGVIRNDRPLRKATRETGGRVIGQVGLGGPLIKLRTSNGSIAVH